MGLYDIIINVCATIQVIINDATTLILQPLYFILQLINDIIAVWNATDEEQQDGEQQEYPKPTHIQGFRRQDQEEEG